MLSDIFTNFVLASFVILPLTLRISRKSVSKLFEDPSSQLLRILYRTTLIAQLVGAIASLEYRLRLWGEPISVLAGFSFFIYLWIRTFDILRGGKGGPSKLALPQE